MASDGGWQTLLSRYLFESRWFKVRQDDVLLPNGTPITYTMIEHPGFVVVVPMLDDGQVLLERLYRYTLQDYTLECPAGGLDGDPPEVAARRELLEETGYVADVMTPLATFNASTGISNEVFHIFIATGLRSAGDPHREPAEQQMELIPMPLDRAARLAESGEMRDSSSALAVILANNRSRRT